MTWPLPSRRTGGAWRRRRGSAVGSFGAGWRRCTGSNVADLDAEGQADAARRADTPVLVDASGCADVSERSALGRAQPADAAFTRQPGRVCAILTADCLPIVLAAESGDLVAALHAGWRGLAGGVIEATVRALGVAPGRLMAWLGPAIGPRHFEVGADVREALLQGDSGAEEAFVPNSRGRFMADLPALTRRRLASLGVDRIYGEGHCTFADHERYFSHRRDGVTGRQATLIWLQPPRLEALSAVKATPRRRLVEAR